MEYSYPKIWHPFHSFKSSDRDTILEWEHFHFPTTFLSADNGYWKVSHGDFIWGLNVFFQSFLTYWISQVLYRMWKAVIKSDFIRQCTLSRVWLFRPQWTIARPPLPWLLCSWDFPGQNAGMGCHFFLQGTFPPRDQTWGSWISCTGRRILLALSHKIVPYFHSLGSKPKLRVKD